MLPLRDNVPTRTLPLVTYALIVANVLVWVLYQLPDLQGSVDELAYHPCEVEGSCATVGESWPLTAFTSMFMHGSWDHILGNMLFLAIFGKNVEDAFGHLRYLAFYVAGGFVATMTQTAVTLLAGSAADAQVAQLGASGAIAAVLGAYFVLYPGSRVLTLVFVFLRRIPAYVFLGLWFLFQLVEGNLGLLAPGSHGGGTAFFAHIGGFLFGVAVARIVAGASSGIRVASGGPAEGI